MGALADEDVSWVIANGVQLRVRAGDVVISEDVVPDHVFVVLEGSFMVSSAQLRQPELQRVGVGELLGEVSYVSGRAPAASVYALTDGVLLGVHRWKLDEKIAADAEFSSRFHQVISAFAVERLYQFGHRGIPDPGPPGEGADLRVHELIEKMLRGEFE
jgi:CRP-like cAMP-binding protein